MSVGIGVAGAGAGHGGDIVVGALVVLLLVGVLPAVAVSVGALVRGHAWGMARAATVAVLVVVVVVVVIVVVVGIVVLGGLAGTAVGIYHAVWAGLGVTSVAVLIAVSAIRVAIGVAWIRWLVGDPGGKSMESRSMVLTSVVTCPATVIAHLRGCIVC